MISIDLYRINMSSKIKPRHVVLAKMKLCFD